MTPITCRGRLNAFFLRCRWPVVVLLGIVPGCASWKERLQPPSITPSRQERAAEVVRDFEERRDAAQLQAALDRFSQGNLDQAEIMLAAIIKRRPGYVPARLRMAELLWSKQDPAAEEHLRAVVQAEPQSAEAHHALGLVLDGTGRADEARQHLAKAAELEPDNEIFCQTRDSLH